MTADTATDFAALLLDTLGNTDTEFVSLGYEDTAGTFRTAVAAPADALNWIPALPATANIFFGVNPTRGPARKRRGRGTENDVTRLAGLWCDLDVKPGGCASLDVARAIIANLSIILGTRPSVTVDSGHGLHAYWPISDGHIAGAGIAAARALIRRWGRLVAVVAATLGAGVDNVYELDRMLRVPDTFNCKNRNGQGPVPVTAHPDTGHPLTIAEVDERLTEVGIVEEDEDREAGGEEISAPSTWRWAQHTCGYAAAMIDNFPTDRPKPGKGRHQWLLYKHVKLACAHRHGCITEDDYRRACQALGDRFTEIVTTTEPRREPKRFEIAGKKHSARGYGVTKTAAKTDEQVAGELGGHTHEPGEQAGGDDTADGGTAGDDPSAAWTFIDGATFILDVPDTIPALIGENDDVLWAEGESLMVAGPMGLGKTTLAISMLRAQLGLGDRTVLGLPVAERPGIILYLAMDRPAQIARAAHRIFTEDERDLLAERVRFWKGPPPADIARNPGLLLALAEAAGAQTVYLDSIKDAAIGLSDDEVGAGYNRARQLLLANGVQLAEQHHTVKRGAGGGPPTTVADIYGSAWIANGTGSIVLLSGEPGDPIVGFRHVRAPADEIGPYRLLHDQTTGTITIEHAVGLVALATACGADGLTAKTAAEAKFDTDKPSRAQIEKMRRSLDKLTVGGWLVCVEGTKGGAKGGTPTVWFAS